MADKLSPITLATAIGYMKEHQGSSTMLVKTVQSGDTFPTTRPDGSALLLGDWIKPKPDATFPFTISGITFNSINDQAVWGGASWLYNANPFQRTNETPVASKSDESLAGTSDYQSGVNKEFKEAISARKAKDVEVNGTSVVDGNGIAKIPLASKTDLGVGKVDQAYGIKMSGTNNDVFGIVCATDDDLKGKTNYCRPVVPNNLDKAIMEGLGNNSLTWTQAYKDKAKQVLGITDQIVQVSALPVASATELGKIYQYIGATSGGLVKGYFYICEEVTPATTPATYRWVNKLVQDDTGLTPEYIELLGSIDDSDWHDGGTLTADQVALLSRSELNYIWLNGMHRLDFRYKDDSAHLATYASSDVNKTHTVEINTNSKAWRYNHTLLAKHNELQIIQVATLPTASSSEEGKIYQFIGTTTTDYTKGYFYICEEITPSTSPKTYRWVNKLVQAGGSGQSIQVTELPTPSASELGKIYQYIGETTADYTNGYFYKCYQDSSVAGVYFWLQINIQGSDDKKQNRLFIQFDEPTTGMVETDLWVKTPDDIVKHNGVVVESPVFYTNKAGSPLTYDEDGYSYDGHSYRWEEMTDHVVDDFIGNDWIVECSFVERAFGKYGDDGYDYLSTFTSEEGTIYSLYVYRGTTWKNISGGSSVNVIDNLESTSATDALSANMGRQLGEEKQQKIYFQTAEPDDPKELDIWVIPPADIIKHNGNVTTNYAFLKNKDGSPLMFSSTGVTYGGTTYPWSVITDELVTQFYRDYGYIDYCEFNEMEFGKFETNNYDYFNTFTKEAGTNATMKVYNGSAWKVIGTGGSSGGYEPDNETLDLNDDDEMEIKDGGITFEKFNDNLVSQNIDFDDHSTEKVVSEYAIAEQLQKKIFLQNNTPTQAYSKDLWVKTIQTDHVYYGSDPCTAFTAYKNVGNFARLRGGAERLFDQAFFKLTDSGIAKGYAIDSTGYNGSQGYKTYAELTDEIVEEDLANEYLEYIWREDYYDLDLVEAFGKIKSGLYGYKDEWTIYIDPLTISGNGINEGLTLYTWENVTVAQVNSWVTAEYLDESLFDKMDFAKFSTAGMTNCFNYYNKFTNDPTYTYELYVFHNANWKLVSGGGSGVNVIDNLTSTSATDALSANQGRVLNENKQKKLFLQETTPSGAEKQDIWIKKDTTGIRYFFTKDGNTYDATHCAYYINPGNVAFYLSQYSEPLHNVKFYIGVLATISSTGVTDAGGNFYAYADITSGIVSDLVATGQIRLLTNSEWTSIETNEVFGENPDGDYEYKTSWEVRINPLRIVENGIYEGTTLYRYDWDGFEGALAGWMTDGLIDVTEDWDKKEMIVCHTEELGALSWGYKTSLTRTIYYDYKLYAYDGLSWVAVNDTLRYLKDTDVVNDLVSSDTNKPLSAKMGKSLKSLISGIAGGVQVVFVTSKPSSPTNNTIYYIGSSAPYTIEMYTTSAGWTALGTSEISLTDYVKLNEVTKTDGFTFTDYASVEPNIFTINFLAKDTHRTNIECQVCATLSFASGRSAGNSKIGLLTRNSIKLKPVYKTSANCYSESGDVAVVFNNGETGAWMRFYNQVTPSSQIVVSWTAYYERTQLVSAGILAS